MPKQKTTSRKQYLREIVRIIFSYCKLQRHLSELCALLLQLYLLIEVLCQPGFGLCLLLRVHFEDTLSAQVILHIGNFKKLLLIKHVQNAADIDYIK